jgi:rubredoxin
MFRCQICGASVPPRVRAARVVVRQRTKQYPYRPRANVIYRPDHNGKVKEYEIDDPGGTGWEIAKEALACPICAMGEDSPEKT